MSGQEEKPSSVEPSPEDGEQILEATLESEDEVGPLSIRVRAWTRTYGPYVRYALRVTRRHDAEEPRAPGARGGHPFQEVDPDDLSESGRTYTQIVADNEATRALIALISRPDAELQDLCGNSDATRYRARLIACLDSLWD